MKKYEVFNQLFARGIDAIVAHEAAMEWITRSEVRLTVNGLLDKAAQFEALAARNHCEYAAYGPAKTAARYLDMALALEAWASEQ